MRQKRILCLKIFIYAFQLSATTFGGGYVIVPLVQQLFVEKLNWIDEEEMLDFIAIAQTAPGSIAVNVSVLVGKKLSGTAGVVFAVMGTISPPLIIISVISICYSAFTGNILVQYIFKGMQASVIALIVSSVINMSAPYLKTRQYLSVALAVLACVLSVVFHVSVVYIICGSGIIGIIFALLSKKRKGGANDLP